MTKPSRNSPKQKESCSNGKRKQNITSKPEKKRKIDVANEETTLLNPWYLKNNDSLLDNKPAAASQAYPWSTQRPSSPGMALPGNKVGLGSASRQSQVSVKDEEDDSSAYEDLDCEETVAEVNRYNGRSISDAVQAIMSDGGLVKDGAFVRENTPKKKKKNKKKKNKKSLNIAAGNVVTDTALVNKEKINGSNVLNNDIKNSISPSMKEVHQPIKRSLEKDCQFKLSETENIKEVSVAGKLNKITKLRKAKLVLSSDIKEAVEPPVTAVTQSTEPVSDSTNTINSHYTDKAFKKALKQMWSDSSEPSVLACPEGAVVLQDPFKVAHLPDFVVSSNNLLARLRSQLLALPMRRMSNDLYKFHQTDELPATGACLELRQLLLGPVRKWLKRVTGIPLDDRLALSASLYSQSDVLLCHDDELCGRRVAFILYLLEQPWGPGDGGSLDLFSEDGSGRPQCVLQRLYPRHNSFAFFQVSPVSYHQVAEVVSPLKARLSVSGWLFGPDIERPPRPQPPLKRFSGHCHVEEHALYASVSPLYLAESLQASIRAQFRRHSEIQLDDFVPEELYLELCRELRGAGEERWSWTGPPNRMHYQVCPQSSSSGPAVTQFLRVLRSEAMMLVLSQLTGLCLHPLAPPEEEESENEEEESDYEGEELDGGEEELDDEGEESSSGSSSAPSSKERKSQGWSSTAAGGCSSDDGRSVECKTLKTLLKEHKTLAAKQQQHKPQQRDASSGKKKKKGEKQAGRTDQQQQESQDDRSRDFCGLDRPWVPDVGVELAGAPTEVSGSGSPAAAAGAGSHVVFSSVRRISHGCYSLMMDDDNTTDNTFLPVTAAAGEAGATTAGAAAAAAAGQSSTKSDKKKKKKEGKTAAGAAEGGVQQQQQEEEAPAGGVQQQQEEEAPAGGVQQQQQEEAPAFVLDLYLSLNVPEHWNEDLGGHTAYVAKGDKEELLSVTPRSNSLALVYRDADTFSFLKHVNCGINSSGAGSGTPNSQHAAAHFHQIFCQYK